ncbi:hypothetical protein [Rubrivirga sp.]|uniref:hypothetical protein n=1 Tax=Rubrivirga sp. TaxID=1885344 RepID=UPI003C71227F
MSERWVERFEQAGLLGRVGLVGGGAVKLLASAIDRGLDRAATITVDAKEAFERELDPNMTDATILEEFDRDDERG